MPGTPGKDAAPAPNNEDAKAVGEEVPCERLPMATADQLRARYHHLSRVVHPDKCPLPCAPHAFAAINKAYTIALASISRPSHHKPAEQTQVSHGAVHAQSQGDSGMSALGRIGVPRFLEHDEHLPDPLARMLMQAPLIVACPGDASCELV